MRIKAICIAMSVCTFSGYAQTDLQSGEQGLRSRQGFSEASAVEQERELAKTNEFLYDRKLKDDRPVVGVAAFKTDKESPYVGLVTEKIVEILKESGRFNVVDRTNRDKTLEELELQKREEFIENQDVALQGQSVAAQKMIQGTITKLPIYRIKNTDGTVRAFKASVAFQLKVDDVATGETTEAVSFESGGSKECLSPQAAVQMAMNSLQDEIKEYFRVTFPLTCKIAKVEKANDGVAETILLKAGKKQGVKVGDEFIVETIERIDGEPLPTEVARIAVVALAGEGFSRCKVNKRQGQAIYDAHNANVEIRCTMVNKK